MKEIRLDEWEDDDEYIGLPTGVGSLFPIGSYTVTKKVYRRPIGFLADIDTLVDEDGNERRVQKVPLKPRKNKRTVKPKQGAQEAGEGGPGKKGRRKGSRSQGRQPEQRWTVKLAGPVSSRE